MLPAGVRPFTHRLQTRTFHSECSADLDLAREARAPPQALRHRAAAQHGRVPLPLTTGIHASRHRSRNAPASEPFGRCAAEKSPRARGTPGVLRTHGLRHLATPERNGNLGRDRRPVVVDSPQVRLLSDVPRAVFIGLLRAAPGGLSFQDPYAVASSGPTHRFRASTAPGRWQRSYGAATKRLL